MRFLDGGERSASTAIAEADVLVLASEGDRVVPDTLLRALGAGVVPVTTRLPAYEELLADGRHGLLFEPGDTQTLAAQLTRLITEPELRERLRDGAAELRERLSWERVADELEEIYGSLVKRRHDGREVAEIKRQGGLVYVPHPFDRMHSVPDYEHLLSVLDDVDAVEVFNPRIAINEFNEEAVRFAAKYRIPGGAGSDAHVPQGLGSVRIRMRAFDGPEEFLESLRDADIIRNPASLLYVQALKFLQTRALPEAARRSSRDRRVRRAARKS